MTKKELKNGMIVETRNGNRYLVLNDILTRKEGYINKFDLNDDLTARNRMNCLDVMKVYEEINTLNFDEADIILWERKENPTPKLGDIYVDECDGEKIMIVDIDEDSLSYPYLTINICNNNINNEFYDEAELSEYKFVGNDEEMARDFNLLFEKLKKAH